MPIAEIQLPDGRIAELQVPEDATEEQIINFAQSQFSQDQPTESITEQALIGLGRGFTDVGEGMAQVGLQAGEAIRESPIASATLRAGAGIPGIGPLLFGASAGAQQTPEGATEEFTRRAQEERALFERGMGDSTAASVGRFAGNVLPALAAPTTGAARSLPGLAKALGGEAAIGTAQESLGFVPEGGSRTEQAAMGGLFGAGGRGFVEGVGAGARGLASRAARREAAQTDGIQQLSEQFDVPVTQGERTGNQSLQRLETQLERIPAVGIRGFRERQSESLKRAAGKLRDEFAGDFDDVGGALQRSLKGVYNEKKDRASKLYDKVEELAKDKPFSVIPRSTKQVADQLIQSERALPALQNAGLVNTVQEFTELAEMPFSQARNVRSRLLKVIRDTEKKAATGASSDVELAALKQLQQGLERDIEAFAARAGGGLEKAFRRANEFFKNEVVPFKDRNFRRIISDDFDTDNILATFIKRDSVLRGRQKSAENLVGKLDLEGRKAVKFSILSEAFDRATNAADNVPFSPAKFANEIQKLSDANKVIFSKPEKAQLDGFVKLAEATKRAGQFAENPPTGVRAADLMLGGGVGYGAAASPGAAALALGGIKSTSLLLTTDTGRKILEKLGRLRVGSKNWQRLERQAASEIARITASRASAQAGAGQEAQ